MTGYGQFCSMARAHDALGGRWTLLIVREILCGSRRFNDIRRGIPRVSRTVLSERLQALVLVGAVARTDGPHGPEYTLTEAGQELASLVSALGTWGQRWLARAPANEDLDLEPLLIDMQRRVRFAALPKKPLVVRFEVRRPPTALHAPQEGRSFALSPEPGLSRAGVRAGTAGRPGRLVARRHELRRGPENGACD